MHVVAENGMAAGTATGSYDPTVAAPTGSVELAFAEEWGNGRFPQSVYLQTIWQCYRTFGGIMREQFSGLLLT
jgi:hypothetical protein